MTNQSFAEFKTKKRQLEAEIIRLCNDFSKEFGVKVGAIYIDAHTNQIGSAPQIFSLKVEIEI